MQKRLKPKTDREVMSLSRKVGLHAVGGVSGLCLRVRETKLGLKTATWQLRKSIDGKQYKKSFGEYPVVSLTTARQLATKFVAPIYEGKNPFQIAANKKENKKRRAIQKAKNAVTFESALSEWLDFKQDRDWKHQEDTRIKEEARIRNHLGWLMKLPLNAITTDDIAEALRPIWCCRRATADRLLTHLRSYFRWAMSVKKCRERGHNPADCEFLRDLLPPEKRRKKKSRCRL